MEERILRSQDGFQGRFNILWIGQGSGSLDPFVALGGVFQIGQGHILGELQNDRSRPAHSEIGEGPSQEFRNSRGLIDPCDPFGHVLKTRQRVESGKARLP
jgi:hypothetical protein